MNNVMHLVMSVNDTCITIAVTDVKIKCICANVGLYTRYVSIHSSRFPNVRKQNTSTR